MAENRFIRLAVANRASAFLWGVVVDGKPWRVDPDFNELADADMPLDDAGWNLESFVVLGVHGDPVHQLVVIGEVLMVELFFKTQGGPMFPAKPSFYTFYRIQYAAGRIGTEVNHVKEPTPRAEETGYQVRQPAEENAEAKGAGEKANRNEEMTQHSAWLLLAGVGVVRRLAPSIPWLGKLPGDISVERESFRLHFPLVTCILLSLLLTGIMWLFRF